MRLLRLGCYFSTLLSKLSSGWHGRACVVMFASMHKTVLRKRKHGFHPLTYPRTSAPLANLLIIASLLIGGCFGPIPGDGVSSQSKRAAAKKRYHSQTQTVSSNEASSRLRVNGEVIEASEIWNGRLNDLKAQAQASSPQTLRDYVARESARLIRDKIAEVLLYQQATLRTPQDLDTRLAPIVDAEIRKTVTTEFGGIQRRYEKHLENQGLTLLDTRDQIGKQIIVSQYLDTEVRSQLPEPTRAELYEMFREDIDEWRRPSKRRMSLIEVDVINHLPASVSTPTRSQQAQAKQSAMEKIELAREELENGAPFADVARRYSEGLSAADGGTWSWVTVEGVRRRYVSAVETLYKLDYNKVSPIVEGDDGFFIVRCDEIDPGFEPDFIAIQPELREKYLRALFNREIAKLVDELRQKARIIPEDISLFHEAVVENALQWVWANDT